MQCEMSGNDERGLLITRRKRGGRAPAEAAPAEGRERDTSQDR